MRKFLLSLLFVLAASTVTTQKASAQSPIIWRGVAEITAVTLNCSANNWQVGTPFSYVHRPRGRSGVNNLNNNGPHTYLSLYRPFYAHTFRFANRDIRGAALVNVLAMRTSTRGGWTQFTAQAENATTLPAVVNSTVDTVSFEVTIRDFDNVAGCNVTIRGAGTRRST